MKNFQALVIFAVVCGAVGLACTNANKMTEYRQDVFVNGKDGYDTYRIPAMVVTAKGTVLAFCEGRKNGHEDTGDIDLLLKRSGDNGRSWSKQVVVYGKGLPNTIGNPCPIVERGSGRVHLLFTLDYSRIFSTTSSDDGRTWSVPKEHTEITDGLGYPIKLIATGPGHGIQMQHGRLVVPIWICNRTRENRYKNITNDRMRAGIIYSDDKGKTWKPGGLAPDDIGMLHEGTVAEGVNGCLMLNMRTYKTGFRSVSVSMDSGATWTKPVLGKQLPDPTCEGSIFRASGGGLYFLNLADSGKTGIEDRRNLTLRLSRDQGKTWVQSLTVNQGPSGYSDLAETASGDILCLFENGKSVYREKITLALISRNWIGEPEEK